MQNSEDKRLFSKIVGFKTPDLINLYNETEKQMACLDIFTVRETIMQVLESRHKKEFDSWIDADYPNDKIQEHFKGVC